MLLIVSATLLAFPAWSEWLPRMAAKLFSGFVQPGIVIWWFVLGGPYQTRPYSPSGIAFAIAANAAFWFLMLGLVVVIGRAVCHRSAAMRS
ncbi:MAG: hypothetical protein ACRETW_00290 [Stenotrophobium sp.]